MDVDKQTLERITKAVWGAPEQRIRPIDLAKRLEQEYRLPPSATKSAVNELVGDGELVYTYRDPCSYVEVPFAESHHAARPMKVIPDKSGEYWICDDSVDPSGDLVEQGCWRCGDLAFTADD